MKKVLNYVIVVLILALLFSFLACVLSGALLSPKSLSLLEPYVCPPGTEIEGRQSTHSYHRPGESSVAVWCVDAHGGFVRDVTFQVGMALWLIFLVPTLPVVAVLTLVVWLIAWLRRRLTRAQAGPQVDGQTAGAPVDAPQGEPQGEEGGGMQRLQELKGMLDAGLITPEEYQAKKNEILSEL
jgi:hypothetical protein